MKKNKSTIVGIAITSFFFLTSLNTEKIVAQEQENKMQDFYMNGGCTKVDSITCYGYDDL